MKRHQAQCTVAMKISSNRRQLSAVERSRLDMHLRRCAACENAVRSLSAIENAKPEVSLSKDAKSAIWDRLLPSVHEIAGDLEQSREKAFPFFQVFGAVGGIAAVASLIMLVGYFGKPSPFVIASGEAAPRLADVSDEEQYVDSTVKLGILDMRQGRVSVDGVPLGKTTDTFSLEEGTRVTLAQNAKVNFRMGRSIKIALVDDVDWTVREISPSRVGLWLSHGRLAVDYDSASTGRILEVETPTSTIRVVGTVFTVSVYEDGITQVSVARGKVMVTPKEAGSAVVVSSGELVQFPGSGRLVRAGDEQALLTEQVVGLADNLVDAAGRLVHFDSGEPHVQVEVEGNVLGFTPLTVRLQPGELAYRLSKPGMETIESVLSNQQIGEDVVFQMVPSTDYTPRTARQLRRGIGTLRTGGGMVSFDESVAAKGAKNIIRRAKAAMASGNLPYATRLLEETVQLVKGENRVSTLSLLAECYVATGDHLRAADTYDRVVDLVPGTPLAQNSRYEVGRLSMDHIGDFRRARAAFTAYVASPVGGQLKEDAYFSLCELSGRKGERREAMGCFNDFLRMFPSGIKSDHAHLWRGVLQQEAGQQWRAAERDLQRFIRRKPRHPRCEEARYRIALGRYHSRDYSGAMRMLNEYDIEHPGGSYSIRVERLRDAISASQRR